jgi:hypothetical protein
MKKSLKWSIAATVVLIFVSQAIATTRYVSSYSGNDANDGSSSSAPCKTIQHAIAGASSGDEIIIAAFDVETSNGFPPVTTTNTCTYTNSGSSAVISLASGDSLSFKGGYIYTQTTHDWTAGIIPTVVDGQNARRGLHNQRNNAAVNLITG